MRVIVLVDITDSLLYHGKKWSECSQTDEIHDMLQSGCIFQRSFYQANKFKANIWKKNNNIKEFVSPKKSQFHRRLPKIFVVIFIKNKISTNLHWEVIMRMIVLVDVPNCLFDHGKKWSECSQTSEIHNMLQSGSIFQRSFDQAIRREKWHHWSCCISLDFDYGWNGFSGGVTLKKNKTLV